MSPTPIRSITTSTLTSNELSREWSPVSFQHILPLRIYLPVISAAYNLAFYILRDFCWKTSRRDPLSNFTSHQAMAEFLYLNFALKDYSLFLTYKLGACSVATS